MVDGGKRDHKILAVAVDDPDSTASARPRAAAAPPDDASPVLPGLQAARGQIGRGRRIPAGGNGAAGHRGLPAAVQPAPPPRVPLSEVGPRPRVRRPSPARQPFESATSSSNRKHRQPLACSISRITGCRLSAMRSITVPRLGDSRVHHERDDFANRNRGVHGLHLPWRPH